MRIAAKINGTEINGDVEPRETLADFVRDRCGLTATHLGCEHGVCGACTVVVDGRPPVPAWCSPSCATAARSIPWKGCGTIRP